MSFLWLRRTLSRLIFRLRADHTTEDLIRMGLTVGDNFLRMHGVILDPSHCWLISIGNNVTLAPRVHVLAHDASTCHCLGYARIGRVDIGDNVFVGAESVILPGVSIGNNVVIGANSTVSRSIPDNSVAAGSPARVIGSYDDFVKKNRELLQHRPCYGEDYTLRGNITADRKKQMIEQLKSGCGFVK